MHKESEDNQDGFLSFATHACVSAVMEMGCSPTRQTTEIWHPDTTDWAHRPGSVGKFGRRLGALSQAGKADAEGKKELEAL